ncbi:PREDICTED: protein tyrosine phosphatase domain-containing protein 1-like [Priapulus caudatus]|uniref:Protein tyrosine phosphatase domain-containing protein 1-like n=1 Tax=Priapulus caudatus TaxID=37621 RepID=A0ABM1EBP4_PRICU|nr:PREDICTED: protein tyrosine phosphatase domain-containing protein 1-like [Priapulus caudatus]
MPHAGGALNSQSPLVGRSVHRHWSDPAANAHGDGEGTGLTMAAPIVTATAIAEALLSVCGSEEVQLSCRSYQVLLNSHSSAWDKLAAESDINVLTRLLWSWIEHLNEPVIREQDLVKMVQYYDNHVRALRRLDKGTKNTVEFLVCFLAKLQPIPDSLHLKLLHRLVAALKQDPVLPLDQVENLVGSTDLFTNDNFERAVQGKVLVRAGVNIDVQHSKLLALFAQWLASVRVQLQPTACTN